MVGQHLTSTPIQQHQPSESPTATAATHEFQRKEHAADGRFEGASEAQGAGRQQQLGPHGAVAGAYPEKRTQQHHRGILLGKIEGKHWETPQSAGKMMRKTRNSWKR